MQSTRFSFKIFIKLYFSRRIFGKSTNKFKKEHPSSRIQVAAYGETEGQTDRQDEANGLPLLLLL